MSSSPIAAPMRAKVVTLGFGLLLAAACASEGNADAVAITSTDSECRVARTALDAGDNTFEVDNAGDRATEVYIYAEGDRVVTEKENIGPGTKATFSADLTAGTYEIACKPGQEGDGIRQTITVTGSGGSAAEAADRTVKLGATEHAFSGMEGFSAKVGETVEFEMANQGTEEHEFEVLKADGTALGEIGPTKPGSEGKATLTFAEPGTYRFVCGIDDHEALGMAGTFTVG